MRLSSGAIAAALTVFSASTLAGQQLRDDSYTWYLGAQGGMLFFETQTQERTGIPSFGIQATILAKRAGLQLAIDEAFASDDSSAFAFFGEVVPVSFDRLRKYSATLMAWPIKATVEPYIGVGFGILHTVGTDVGGIFTTPEEAGQALSEAKDRGSTGFGSFLIGVQGAVSPTLRLFARYQITTSPSDGKLLVGPTHQIVGGLRVSLGGAREGVKGGGY